MKQKNTKYTNDLLFLRSEIMNSNAYKQSLNGFLDNFKINGKEYVIYNVWIKTLLLWGLLPEHKNELKNIKINSHHYQDCYVKGYEKGQKYFIGNYENDPRETKETLVNNILYLNKDVSLLLPNELSYAAWFDSALVITSLHNSVNDTILITAHINEPDSLLEIFPIASKIFEVSPDNFPVFGSLTIKLRADSLPEWGNWSVFQTNGHNKLTFLKSKIDTNKLEITTRTSSLGKFVVASDTIAPEIEIKSPKGISINVGYGILNGINYIYLITYQTSRKTLRKFFPMIFLT